jgi:hypothetical protein
MWESEKDVTTYEVLGPASGRSLEGRQLVPDPHRPGKMMVDVSNNVGRGVAVGGLFLWAAARMWFGPVAFRLVSRDRLLVCPVGKISEREDGVIDVELYSLSDPIEQIREAQRLFREWMGYDELAQRARRGEVPDVFDEVEPDPEIAISVGDGKSTYIEYYTDDGNPVRRSRSTVQRVYGSDGPAIE